MIIFEHLRCPLHRHTFSVEPLQKWVESNCEGQVFNLFAGKTHLRVPELRNDLDSDMPAAFHLDALELLRTWEGPKFSTILLDPPYSYRKSMEMYQGKICSPFRQLKDAIPLCPEPSGIVRISSYHSVVMGKRRSFRLEKVVLFSPGGAIQDTIASLERYLPEGPAP